MGVLFNLSKTNLVIFLRTFQNVLVVGGNDSNCIFAPVSKSTFNCASTEMHTSFYIYIIYTDSIPMNVHKSCT